MQQTEQYAEDWVSKSNMNELSLINIPLEDAIKSCEDAGFAYRVVARDGKYFVCTQDYRTDRYNLKVVNNLVVESYLG